MGGVCSSCFERRRNAPRSDRLGQERPRCWRRPTFVYRSVNNYLVPRPLSTNTTTTEHVKLDSGEQKSDQPEKECVVVLSTKNAAENNEETEKSEVRHKHVFSSWEDEDVCPTCFEDYTVENPKIIAHCSHHYHLGCIYDWMERSKDCPMCGQLMEFEGMQ